MKKLYAATFLLIAATTSAFAGDAATPCLAPQNTGSTIEALNQNIQSATQRLNPLVKISRELTKEFDQNVPERIPDATLDQLWKNIEGRLGHLRGWTAKTPAEVSERLQKRLKALFDRLKAQRKFRYLTQDARKKLGVDEYLCKNNKEKCKDLLGFYNPLTNHIVLDPSLSQDEAAVALFHELLHAEQFTYRFPLDLEKLNSIAKEGKLRKDDINAYLSAYYEYQANYQGMRITGWRLLDKPDPSKPSDWNNTFQGPYDKGVGYALTQLFTLNHADTARRAYMNKHLPYVDQAHESGQGLTTAGYWMSALTPSELVPVGNYALGAGWYDLEWHCRYLKALNKAYYDDHAPTLYCNSDDWKPQLELHDHYYRHIGATDTLEQNPACAALIKAITAPGDAPLVRWLERPAREVQKCPAYPVGPSQEERDRYTNAILSQSPSSSKDAPFIFRDGTEGDRPGLRVYPIQPQLKVLPND